MKLAILDPGYKELWGHHHMVNLGISSNLLNKGIDTIVFAAKNFAQIRDSGLIPQKLNINHFFQTPCYPTGVDSLSKGEYSDLVCSFSIELKALFESSLLDDIHSIYLHTGFSFHLQALGEVLKKIKFRAPKTFIISLMFNPSAQIRGESLNFFDTREYFRYKTAFGYLAKAAKSNKLNIKLATSCNAFQRTYQKLWPQSPVEIHPAINQRLGLIDHQVLESPKDRVLLYWGVPKIDKGIEFAAELCVIASQKFPQIDFLFQYNPDFPGAPAKFEAPISRLRELSQKYTNIIFKEGYLAPDTYHSLLNSCKVISILYDPLHYKFKTSGIFWDALLLNKDKWLVSKNTWIADELSELHIPHQSVEYGSIPSALSGLNFLLSSENQPSDYSVALRNSKSNYLNLLTSSFSDWLRSKFDDRVEKNEKALACA